MLRTIYQRWLAKIGLVPLLYLSVLGKQYILLIAANAALWLRRPIVVDKNLIDKVDHLVLILRCRVASALRIGGEAVEASSWLEARRCTK